MYLAYFLKFYISTFIVASNYKLLLARSSLKCFWCHATKFSDSEEVSEALKSCTTLGTCYHKSGQRKTFKNIVTPVPTGWNSTFYMIESVMSIPRPLESSSAISLVMLKNFIQKFST